MISKDTPYILNRLDESTAEMLIYDMIGESWFEEGLTAKRVANDLKELGNVKLLNVHINSQGGSVFHGVAIYNALRRFSNDTRKVHTYIDGAAFSIASVIAMAGDRIFMADNALLMIHDPWALANGNANELRRLADLLDKSKSQILRAYMRKTSEPQDVISQMMSDETYLDADEALDYGFADEIVGEVAVAALSEPLDSAQVPAHVREKFDSFFNFSPDRGENMAEEKNTVKDAGTVSAPIVATIDQLESMPGADASWVLEQLKASATLEQAQASLMQKLFEENQQLRTAPPQASVPRVHQPEDQTSFGVAPLTSETAGVEPQAKSKTVDAHAEYRRIVRDYVRSEGMTLSQAADAFSRNYPELADAICPPPSTLSRRA